MTTHAWPGCLGSVLGRDGNSCPAVDVKLSSDGGSFGNSSWSLCCTARKPAGWKSESTTRLPSNVSCREMGFEIKRRLSRERLCFSCTFL